MPVLPRSGYCPRQNGGYSSETARRRMKIENASAQEENEVNRTIYFTIVRRLWSVSIAPTADQRAAAVLTFPSAGR